MLEKLKNLKMFRTSFVIDDKTDYPNFPTHKEVIAAIKNNLKDAQIIEVRDKVIFSYQGRKWIAEVRTFRGAYYIGAIAYGKKDE